MRRRKFIRNLLLASGGGVAGLALERESAIKPGPPPEKSKGDSRVARPQPGDTPFSKTPIAPDYAARRRMFLEWVAQRGTPPERNGVLIDLVKFEAGTCKAITPAALDDALAFLAAGYTRWTDKPSISVLLQLGVRGAEAKAFGAIGADLSGIKLSTNPANPKP